MAKEFFFKRPGALAGGGDRKLTFSILTSDVDSYNFGWFLCYFPIILLSGPVQE